VVIDKAWVTQVVGQLGIGPESLRKWVHPAEVDVKTPIECISAESRVG
jgi:transposase-like protein